MGRRLPPINAMRVFEAAARHLSFTNAADELQVTQAAVSHQIKALEEWLGVMLFQRLNRGLKLTEEGEMYIGPLTQAFDLMGEATAKLIDKDNRNMLTVSSVSSFASIWLAPRLKNFRDRFKGMNVRLVTRAMDSDLLVKGEVDLDIRYGDGKWQHVQVDPFLTESLFPVCSPELLKKTPLKTYQDLANITLLHDEMVFGWEEWLEGLGVEDVNFTKGPIFSDSQLVLQAAINGEGVALGRGALVADALAKGTLVEPFGDRMPSSFSYYLVSTKNTSDQYKIRVFKNWLRREAEEFMELKAKLAESRTERPD